MLRTAKKELELNVHRCQIVNDGAPYLRITCESVLLTPEQRKLSQGMQNWYLDGAGGPIKCKTPPQFLQRHHMPHTAPGQAPQLVPDAGGGFDLVEAVRVGGHVGWFTTDMVLDLHMPRGVIDIQFGRYNDEVEAIRRAKQEEAEAAATAAAEEAKKQEKARKKAEQVSAVDAFRRKFKNLDLSEDESPSQDPQS